MPFDGLILIVIRLEPFSLSLSLSLSLSISSHAINQDNQNEPSIYQSKLINEILKSIVVEIDPFDILSSTCDLSPQELSTLEPPMQTSFGKQLKRSRSLDITDSASDESSMKKHQLEQLPHLQVKHSVNKQIHQQKSKAIQVCMCEVNVNCPIGLR